MSMSQDYWSVFVISTVDVWLSGRELFINTDIIDENVLPSSFKEFSFGNEEFLIATSKS